MESKDPDNVDPEPARPVLNYAGPDTDAANVTSVFSRRDWLVIGVGLALPIVYSCAGVASDRVQIPLVKKSAIPVASVVIVCLLAWVARGRSGYATWFAFYVVIIAINALVMLHWN